jgi:hypothetical protein
VSRERGDSGTERGDSRGCDECYCLGVIAKANAAADLLWRDELASVGQ